jgi:hypothetical protein
MRGAELRAALEGVRDHWARTTVQDDQDLAYLESEAAIVEARAKSARAERGLAAGESQVDGAQRLRDAVENQRQLIATQNMTPGPDMVGALALIDQGIAHAVSLTEFCGCPCRVSIVGEFNSRPNKINGGHKRISVKVDDASLG